MPGCQINTGQCRNCEYLSRLHSSLHNTVLRSIFSHYLQHTIKLKMPPSSPWQLPAKQLAVAASAATATLLGALYANDRYGVSHDIKQLLSEKAFRKRLQERIQALDSDFSLFHMLELADPEAEALWFENRRWTYAEVLHGESAAISLEMRAKH